MKKILGLVVVVLSFCISKVQAIQVNTAAAVVADSADTNETAVYRDTVGSFDTKTMRVTGSAAGTTDLTQYMVSGSTVARVGPNGHIGLRRYTKAQIDTLVPDFQGALITCVNCNFADALCVSSGTSVAQWYAVKTSTGGTAGGGTHMNGCGTGQ